MLNKAIGIDKGFMTTIHSYTGDQPTLDTLHKDLYRARAAALNLIPTSTGAAKAVGLVLPELNGKLDGVVDPRADPERLGRRLQVRRLAADEQARRSTARSSRWPRASLKGILGYTEDKLVSSDFNHDRHSSIFHMDQTKVMDGTFCRVMSWYDNEWGFSNRMADTAVAFGKLI